jgi:hypothetical protein
MFCLSYSEKKVFSFDLREERQPMRLRYWSPAHTIVGIVLVFVFTTIYQHNLIINLNYVQQRINKQQAALEKDRNELLKELLYLRSPEHIMAHAQQQGMRPLQVQQVIVLESTSTVQFFRSCSSPEITQSLGVCNTLTSSTGRNHACTRP